MKGKIITINEACEQEAAVRSSREQASKIWEDDNSKQNIEHQKRDHLGRKKIKSFHYFPTIIMNRLYYA